MFAHEANVTRRKRTNGPVLLGPWVTIVPVSHARYGVDVYRR